MRKSLFQQLVEEGCVPEKGNEFLFDHVTISGRLTLRLIAAEKIRCGARMIIDPTTGKIIPYDGREKAVHWGVAKRDYAPGEEIVIQQPDVEIE